MRHYIHIGLGKVASSTMQNSIFPTIAKIRPKIKYVAPGHNDYVMKIIRKFFHGSCKSDEIDFINDFVSKNSLLVSWEGLNSWDPHFWDQSSKKIMNLFGENSSILIMVRDTKSYYRSIYQQVVATGDIIPPENFFVSEEDYIKSVKENNYKRMRVFDVDSFDLRFLYKLYNNLFKKTYMVSLDNFTSFQYLKDFFDLKNHEINYIKNEYSSSIIHNRSYSQGIMDVIFFKQKLLNAFHINKEGIVKDKYLLEYNKLPLAGKIIQAPIRISRNIRLLDRIFRSIIKIFPGERYKLPNNILFNDNLIIKNDNYIKELNEE